MADFFQNGSIATFQTLIKRPLADIERELKEFGKNNTMVLLLPALYSEFEGPAMPNILEELENINYLYKIVLSLDRANKAQFEQAKKLISRLPGDTTVIWHDGPKMQALYKELKKAGILIDMPGKGRSVWMSLGYILADPEVYAIGLHDCDIINYKREIVAKLFYPIVHPALDFEFSKGYYARVTEKLYGRVTRLFYTPLIRSLKRIVGVNPFLEYLDSFRYALAGEFAFLAILARGIRISPTWGLEVSMLSEVYTKTSVNRVAQVEIIETYEHKHQEIKINNNTESGLLKMGTDIAKTLLRVLSQDGIEMSDAFFRTVLTTYMREAWFAIEKYNGLAMINGLNYDRHAEIEAIDAFVGALKKGINEFKKDPVGIPMLSAWVRINAALPDFSQRIAKAVGLDNEPND